MTPTEEHHDDRYPCPGNPGDPLDGESWLDYKARCDKWRKDRGLPTGWEVDDETTLPELDSYEDGPIDGYDY